MTQAMLSKAGAIKVETRLRLEVSPEITARYDRNEGAPSISIYWGELLVASIRRSEKKIFVSAVTFPFLDSQLYDKQTRLNAVLMKVSEEAGAVFQGPSSFAI
ncbi:MAG: hypothetical protein A2845_01830 [Candidatus Lloydbacteria bacterium RIFCSPHIGHO2_01_FULL_49_22]|uniref:Uncharacterized protein n=1 Tax=Candidatus Lloydbacteria bacterium RIFCSPHIGHO2_01_FULL_49_22 TaxID=1798658 RepID=A0A1G2CXN5_9BACT|nr:MAG: hypothetical protein A2845_01830 [Candidatus Lloydbacteria bacterium RIFCSPHIGHO2_01_FULL_49_22]OGZ10036.1 MAG: hypothetical protein A3C14_04995 [Candidatus Lloydbacteria bacterium RIFCSPHIGHO2_02_FULL_50_18]